MKTLAALRELLRPRWRRGTACAAITASERGSAAICLLWHHTAGLRTRRLRRVLAKLPRHTRNPLNRLAIRTHDRHHRLLMLLLLNLLPLLLLLRVNVSARGR